jgi:hypothetical protein
MTHGLDLAGVGDPQEVLQGDQLGDLAGGVLGKHPQHVAVGLDVQGQLAVGCVNQDCLRGGSCFLPLFSNS